MKTIVTMGYALLVLLFLPLPEAFAEQSFKISYWPMVSIIGADMNAAKPWLMKLIGQPKKAQGRVVVKVYHGGAAENAGLREGDFITAINGQPVTQLAPLFQNKAFGSTFNVQVVRGTEYLSLSLMTVLPPQISDPTYQRDAEEMAEFMKLAQEGSYQASIKNIDNALRYKMKLRAWLKRKVKQSEEEGHPLLAARYRQALKSF